MMKNESEMQHYFGRISDTAELEKVHPRLKAAFDFLRRKGLATLACGTYELEAGAPGEKAAVRRSAWPSSTPRGRTSPSTRRRT